MKTVDENTPRIEEMREEIEAHLPEVYQVTYSHGGGRKLLTARLSKGPGPTDVLMKVRNERSLRESLASKLFGPDNSKLVYGLTIRVGHKVPSQVRDKILNVTNNIL